MKVELRNNNKKVSVKPDGGFFKEEGINSKCVGLNKMALYGPTVRHFLN